MKRISKSTYETLNKRHSAMLQEGIKLAEKWATDFNLKRITKQQYEQKIDDWETEIFAIGFQVWYYEIQEAFRDYKKQEQDFILNHKMGFVDLINFTPARKKIPYKTHDKINRLTKEITEIAYKKIVNISKRVPVHGLDKNKFPAWPIDLQDDI